MDTGVWAILCQQAQLAHLGGLPARKFYCAVDNVNRRSEIFRNGNGKIGRALPSEACLIP